MLALFCVIISCSQIDSQIQHAIAETQTAAPYPTQTAYPTQKPYPTPTKVPTETPKPGFTWAQMEDFVLNDRTNWNVWTEDYTCVNFSLDLVADAKAHNIKAWIVGVNFVGQETGHVFVAFQTVDRGEIWIEPQSDDAYIVSTVGQPLCLANNPHKCWNQGIISKLLEPAVCDAATHNCYPGSQ